MKKKRTSDATDNPELLTAAELIQHLLTSAQGLLLTDPDQAETLVQKAITLARKSKSAADTGSGLMLLAAIDGQKRQPMRKMQHLHEAVEVFREANLPNETAHGLMQISQLLRHSGQFQAAIAMLDQSLQSGRASGDPVLMAEILSSRGELKQMAGAAREAQADFFAAQEQLEVTGNPELLAAAAWYVADGHARLGEPDLAFSQFSRGLELAGDAHADSLIARHASGLGRLLDQQGEHAKAQKQYCVAIEAARKAQDHPMLAGLLKDHARYLLQVGKEKSALTTLNEARQLSEHHELIQHLPGIYEMLAELKSKSGQYQEAFTLMQQCITASENLRNSELNQLRDSANALSGFRNADPKPSGTPEPSSEQFLLQVGHELRTPLNGVLGMTELLQGTLPTPEQREYINTIRLSARQLLAFADDIFEYQRLLAAPAANRTETVQIRNLIDALYPKLMDLAAAANVKFSLRIDKPAFYEFSGDPCLIEKLIEKLNSFCIQAAAGGTVNTVITLSDTAAKQQQLQLSVTGSGLTLTDEQLRWLETEQAIPDQELTGSVLLPLAIVRKLVSLTGGTLTAKSLPGNSTEFFVQLPMNGIDRPRAKKEPPPVSATSDRGLLQVLLVEDNKVNQFLAQKLLTKMGFEVELASNASEAVEALQRDHFDAILMDVQMPVMTGYELTELIRTTLPPPVNAIPIIALTAYASPQERERAMASGMNEFLTKPYSPEELKAVLLRIASPGTPSSQSLSGALTPADIQQTVDRLVVLFGGNAEDVISLLNMLMVQIPQMLGEAGANIALNDWGRCQQNFHKIRSSINLLRIPVLSNTIEQLEQWTQEPNPGQRIPPLFATFRAEGEKAVAYLREEAGRLRGR